MRIKFVNNLINHAKKKKGQKGWPIIGIQTSLGFPTISRFRGGQRTWYYLPFVH